MNRSIEKALVLAGAAMALAAFRPELAQASTARVDGTEVIFEASAGETNSVEVDQNTFANVGIRDRPNGPTPGAGCFPGANGFVVCGGPQGIATIRIVAEDGADRVDVFTIFPGLGFPRAFVVDLGPGADVWKGSPGNDRVLGGEGGDQLFLSAGVDQLSGGPGTDVAVGAGAGQTMEIGQGAIGGDIENLTGGPGPDKLVGDAGPNQLVGAFVDTPFSHDDITGGDGEDVLSGGMGNDTLRSSDNFRDSVSCGEDNDTAIVDALDAVDPDCETVVTAGPIFMTAGSESSNMVIEINDIAAGVEYFFGDFAPFTIADDRCSRRTDILMVCLSPVEVAVNVDFGPGDDTMTLTGNVAFEKLTVDGGPGADTLVASPVARGGTGDDVIRSGNCGVGECLLEGGDDSDHLFGGTGRDRLRGGPGNDFLGGGGGTDTADYSNFAADIEASLEFGSSIEPQGADDIDFDVENLVGGFGNDTLTGGATSNRIEGGAGEDTLAGRASDDTLDGGAANDTIRGGFAGEGADTLIGGPGVDTLSYADVVDDVRATIGSFARIGSETEQDAVGADIEKLIGGDGNDTLHGDVNGDEAATIEGGPGEDELAGGGGDDILDGEAGDDTLDGGEANDGEDQFIGGPDFDTLSYVFTNDKVDATIAGFATVGGETEDNFVAPDIERLIGSRFGDLLTGSSGDDQLEGGRGDDNLVGAAGADVLDGGDDRDVVTYSGSQPVFVTLGDDLANDGHAGEGDNLRLVEDVVGGDGDDVLVGNEDDNELTGGEGSDRLNGLVGDNFLRGGPGDDVLVGGDEGSDVMSGEAGTDTADYSATVAGVTVAPEPGPGCGDGEAREDCVKDDVENLVGGAGNDLLFGTAAENTLIGNDGGDELSGLDGDDTLDGGAGGDVLVGGLGEDTVPYADRTRGVSVDPEPGGLFPPADDGEPGEGDAVEESVENVIGGAGDDVLVGTAAANRLVGNDGDDTLEGLGGPDVLEGGFGLDMLKSRDGVRDEDFCGPGADTVEADTLDNVSVDCESVSFPPGPPPPSAAGNTPAGTNVSVTPVDAFTLTFPLTVTFASVTVPGQTLLFTSQNGPVVPFGFRLGDPPRFYFISTTAQFTPPITTCIDTTGITFPGGVPRFFHFELGFGWVDRTTSVGPGAQVCGVTTTLSPFAVFASVRCLVPNVKRKTLPAARKTLKKAHCALGRVRRVHSAKVRKGLIVSQRPRPGRSLSAGAKVSVVVSRGPR